MLRERASERARVREREREEERGGGRARERKVRQAETETDTETDTDFQTWERPRSLAWFMKSESKEEDAILSRNPCFCPAFPGLLSCPYHASRWMGGFVVKAMRPG